MYRRVGVHRLNVDTSTLLHLMKQSYTQLLPTILTPKMVRVECADPACPGLSNRLQICFPRYIQISIQLHSDTDQTQILETLQTSDLHHLPKPEHHHTRSELETYNLHTAHQKQPLLSTKKEVSETQPRIILFLLTDLLERSITSQQ